MAQAQYPMTGQKRGPGRPSRAAEPALKKARISTPGQSAVTSSDPSPTTQSPVPERMSKQLPVKVRDNRPLPVLPEAQALSLPKDEYQSIAASAVLHSSLDRSRLKWICDGVFKRYWVRPESGKNAKPPPPNNPELKWQKSKGACRIRIEPHIFEAEVYVEEKAKPQPAPVRQFVPPTHQSAYGQPYSQPQNYYQNRTLPPIQQPQLHSQSPSNVLPPINNTNQSPAPLQRPPSRAQQTTPQQEKKASPDPVISMLANRASSDPELKRLMKEVATGNATQDQLKIFQSHIDELTKHIAEKKKKQEEEEAAAQGASAQQQQQNEVIQYDGPADSVPVQHQHTPQRSYPPPHQQPARAYQQPQQQTWAPPPAPAPTSSPVIIAFTTPGATEDRFIFPQDSILESLSPQHLLASFIVTRRGREAADPTGLDPDTEYWQPITLMVEVAYRREHIIECVQRWVKPAEEVRKYMQEVMERCSKAPDAYLALRLPFKGSALAETEDMVMEDAMPAVEEKVKSRPSVMYVKKALPSKSLHETKSAPKPAPEGTRATAATSTPGQAATEESSAEQKDMPVVGGSMDGTTEVPTSESGRPKRAVRKSVRISEG